MRKRIEIEEYLEKLWYMKEKETCRIDELKAAVGKDFNMNVVKDLAEAGYIALNEDNEYFSLTKTGQDRARKIIRAHRLAERLLHDVFGGEFESGACEFEHMVKPEIVDGICTLLGHPRECPHGMPIPEGECCKKLLKVAHSSVIPLTSLEIGQSARIAYVNCRDDRRLHRIEGLHIRPGNMIKLHQRYPSYVIECEGANIALDENVASNICVWRDSREFVEKKRGRSSRKSVQRPMLCWRRRHRGGS